MIDYGSFEKYQARMADWACETMGSKGKRLPDQEDFTEEELELFNEVFRRFAEISETLDNLDLCLDFIRARAPKRKDLKLDAYLNYHIAFYLQEIYILKERLKKYAIKIMRLRKKLDQSVDRNAYKSVIDMVEGSLSSIVSARGSHVHDRPFSDDKMRMLCAYSFLSVHHSEDPSWSSYAHAEYADIKRAWVKQLSTNKAELLKLLDVFFLFIDQEISDSGLLAPPNNSSTR